MKSKLLLVLKTVFSKELVKELYEAYQEGIRQNGRDGRQLLAEIDAEADRLAAERDASQHTAGQAQTT
jgi:hypothetical protein